MNNDLISRDALKEEIRQTKFSTKDIGILLDLIDNAPSVKTYTLEDLEKAKNNGYKWGKIDGKKKSQTGKWIYHKAEGYFLPTMECSECHANDLLGGLTRKEYKAVNKFCFNCGADMRGGDT